MASSTSVAIFLLFLTVFLHATSGVGGATCCYYSTKASDVCSSCKKMDAQGSWCAESAARCDECGGTFCGRGGKALKSTATKAPKKIKSPKMPAPASPPAPAPRKGGKWTTGTWTTGYWDCLKPSCSWPKKGSVTAPVRSCTAASRGKQTADINEPRNDQGGDAVTCTDNQPWHVSRKLSFGFAAAAVEGKHGLKGDSNCGECYVLKFASEKHPGGWGGSHPSLVGHSMVIQVTNIGYDVKGDHSFDLQIPSGGQGLYTKSCNAMFPGYKSEDFDCGNNYGGCGDRSGCSRLPKELRRGCSWRFDVYKWMEDGEKTNNPYVQFQRTRCPKALTDITGSKPLNDEHYPPYTDLIN